jgi:glutathione S-transferase
MAKTKDSLVFHHSPWSRSAGTRWLLEELGVDYSVHFVNVHAPTGAPESYRKIQAHKKVPAIEHGSLLVTERAAITIYLADAFPQAGLAPQIGDADRARYLTTLVYCDAVFDPCVTARVRGLEYEGRDYSFGAFEDMIAYLERRLSEHPYAAGERFTAADTHLASSLAFTMQMLRAVPEKPVFTEYLARVLERPANVRAGQLDEQLLSEHPEVMEQLGIVQAHAS